MWERELGLERTVITNRLSARMVQTLKASGRYPDGGGLMLFVSDSGSKSWVLRVQKDGRRRDIGLGPYPVVTLAEARTKALVTRRQIHEGIDPVAERKRVRSVPTFREVVKAFIEKQATGWRGGADGITAFQFARMMERFAYARMGSLKINVIDETDILAVLQPLWASKPESARKMLYRFRGVMTYAKGQKWAPRALDWVEIASMAPGGRRDVRHHPALPLAELPGFIAYLQTKNTPASQALLFAILTLARSQEAREATWNEIDLDARLWRIPGRRMKAGIPHDVPLSPAVMQLLDRARSHRVSAQADANDFIFPGQSKGKPLSDVGLSKLLRLAGFAPDVATVHGFRSTFRVWSADVAHAPRELSEACIAHAPEGGATERAYLRTTMIERRRSLMEEWARLAMGEQGKVVPMWGRG